MAGTYSTDSNIHQTEGAAPAPYPEETEEKDDTEEDEKTEEEKRKEAEEDAELVQRAKECYQIGIDATSNWREQALEDLAFLAGDQWDLNVKGMRDMEKRPALTINRLPQFVRQVTNEQRQSKPSVTVSPVDSAADKKTAEVLQGIIRNIEYSSNAETAYAAAGQSAAICGLGYLDVCAEYEDEKSFEQRLTIRRLKNPLQILMDPATKELAGDDARWCLISTDLSKSEWKALFPDKEMPINSDWSGYGDAAPNWVSRDGIRLHEYRYVEDEADTLVEVPLGLVKHIPPGIFGDAPQGGPALAEELIPEVAAQLPDYQPEEGAVLASELEEGLLEKLKAAGAQTRPTTRRKACWCKIAGEEIIQKGEFAGRYLQLVRVVGTELETGQGQTIFEGIVRHAKDTQRMVNYYASAEAESVALAPRSPWLAAEEQVEGYEKMWETANTRAHSVLFYKPKILGGQMMAPPQRVQGEASNIQAITNGRAQAAEDLKAVTGIYDASLGAQSNEVTGKAILARQSQGQTANFHFNDNLAMAIRYTGRILIDLIPKIYSGPRVLRIIGDDLSQEMVAVNQPTQFRGEDVHIELDAGRYDVTVSMGPSYHSRRQEASAQMIELLKLNPSISPIVMDLLVAAMDIPGGDAIADRLRKMLPPEIRPPDEKQPPPAILAQQLQQFMQQNQKLTQALNAAQSTLDQKVVESAAKERIELLKIQADLLKTAATLKNDAHIALLESQTRLIGQRLSLIDAQIPEGTPPPPATLQLQPPPQPPQGQPQLPTQAMNGAPNGIPGQ